MSSLRGSVTDADAREARGFEVVVLGSAGTYPGPGRLCSGYLFRTPSTNVVVDMGYGSTSNLFRLIPPEAIDAVILSHAHADHCVDLVGTYYALRFHADGEQEIDVYAPPGTGEFISSLVPSDSTPGVLDICRFHDVGHGDRLEIGDLVLDLYESVHVVPTVSVRVTDGTAVATYSGDSAGGGRLVEAARGADLFICEASWVGSSDDYDDGVHLTATGAGEVARDADVETLLLTHIWPANDRDRTRDEAHDAFGRDVDLAEDGDIWTVGG
jgi:ribonuclease BN (tRNA processing enzyme)